ncbi:LAME_0G08086g1_1 [Lachancea meyersii CBS 8951]|uniref:LAME_0G08086g1_1 n=1 Tax=Lachancea meyersii CBS 8951 TaxID=1266667 RepID=A0A1G4K841_9SACH|nr:LAME_0G08086g1_1 [Lachancea meyersii CBS 8951]
MPRKHLGSPEQASFELPSLPPWRTPKIKILHHTPSKGRSLLDDRDIFDSPNEPAKDPETPNQQPKNTDVYDFAPFSDKRMLAVSKTDQMLSSESATHCLVFHKDKHKHKCARQDFRPDLNLWCCDSSEDEDEQVSLSESDSHLGSTTGHLLPTERPNVRRLDTGVSTEKIALRRFWNGSDAMDVLEPSQLHDIYSVLQQEQELIHKCERQIQQNEHVSPGTEVDSYKWLRKYCQVVSARDAWMWTEPDLSGARTGGGGGVPSSSTSADYVAAGANTT